MENNQVNSNKVKRYGIVLGIIYLASQHMFYLAGHLLALLFKIPPFLPKIPVIDDAIPIVSAFIIPYVWSYAFWAMGPMAVSKCEKNHFLNYMAANLLSCVLGTIALALLPTYMNRVEEGLFDVIENPDFFDKLRMFWYSLDGSEMAYNLLPSFHCLNSTVCFLGVMGRKEISVGYRVYSLVMMLLTYASTVFVKQHYFVDIITGAALGVISYFICVKFRLGEKWFVPIIEKFKRSREAKQAKA